MAKLAVIEAQKARAAEAQAERLDEIEKSLVKIESMLHTLLGDKAPAKAPKSKPEADAAAKP